MGGRLSILLHEEDSKFVVLLLCRGGRVFGRCRVCENENRCPQNDDCLLSAKMAVFGMGVELVSARSSGDSFRYISGKRFCRAFFCYTMS